MRPQAQPTEQPPDGLVWHYTDAGGLLSIVNNHVLWATAAGFLNDDQEVRLGIGLLGAELDLRAADNDPVARAIQERMASAESERTGPSSTVFFILSAAQHWDLLAMWRCYGGRGESYAIGLDPAAALPVLASAPVREDKRRLLRQRPWSPVAYDAVEQRQLAAAVFDGLPGSLELIRRHELDSRSGLDLDVDDLPAELEDVLDDVEQALLLIKHPGFADERETRHCTLVAHHDGAAAVTELIRYRPTPYGISPYVWLTGSDGSGRLAVAEPAPLPIRAVAISPSPNGPDAVDSLRGMLRSRGYEVPVLRSRIPFRG